MGCRKDKDARGIAEAAQKVLDRSGFHKEFTPSPFVKKITGVDNVCERSAVLASGNGRLLQRKTGENGVTTAVAAREWRIHFE